MAAPVPAPAPAPATRCFICDSEISFLLYQQSLVPFHELKPHLLASLDPSVSQLAQNEWNKSHGGRNTEKLCTVLQYFLPNNGPVSLRKYSHELTSHKFPLCFECDEHIEKIQEVEKEVDSLKNLINSLIASLQFKVKSIIQNNEIQSETAETDSETRGQTEKPELGPTDEILAAMRGNLIYLEDIQSSLASRNVRVALNRINMDGRTTVKLPGYTKKGKVATGRGRKPNPPKKRGRPPKAVSKKKQAEIKGKIYRRIKTGMPKNLKKNKAIKVEEDEVKVEGEEGNDQEGAALGPDEPRPENSAEGEGQGDASAGGDIGNGDGPETPQPLRSNRIKRKPMKLYSDDEDEPGKRHRSDDVDDDADNGSLYGEHASENGSDWNSGDDRDVVELDSGDEYHDTVEQQDGNASKEVRLDEDGNPIIDSSDAGENSKAVKPGRGRKRKAAGGKPKTEKPVKERKKREPKAPKPQPPKNPNPKRLITKPPRPAVKILEIQPRLFQFQEGAGCQFIHQEDGQFQCCTCMKVFSKRTRVIVHIRYIHLGYDLGLLGEYLCNLCGKSFNREGSLKLHEQSMHGTKSHMCSICGRLFALAGNLRSHMLIHGEQRKFACEVEGCDRKFLRKKELLYHTNKHHLNMRPHQCDLCGKTYTRHSELLLHQRSHSGQRPFQCQLCESNFFLKARLTRHMRRVHKMVDFMPERTDRSRQPPPQMMPPANNNMENPNPVEYNEMQVCDDFVANLINVVTAPVITTSAAMSAVAHGHPHSHPHNMGGS